MSRTDHGKGRTRRSTVRPAERLTRRQTAKQALPGRGSLQSRQVAEAVAAAQAFDRAAADYSRLLQHRRSAVARALDAGADPALLASALQVTTATVHRLAGRRVPMPRVPQQATEERRCN